MGIRVQTGSDSSEGKSEKEWRDDGQERPKGVHLKDNPGKEQNSEQRHEQRLQTLEGEDMPGRGLSGHGGWRVRDGH